MFGYIVLRTGLILFPEQSGFMEHANFYYTDEITRDNPHKRVTLEDIDPNDIYNIKVFETLQFKYWATFLTALIPMIFAVLLMHISRRIKKSKKNMIIAVVGTIILFLIVFLVYSGAIHVTINCYWYKYGQFNPLFTNVNYALKDYHPRCEKINSFFDFD